MPQTPELLLEIWAWKVTKRGETWVHNSLEALWSTQWVVIYACRVWLKKMKYIIGKGAGETI